MCVSCPHVAVTQFSGSETWLHCQGAVEWKTLRPCVRTELFCRHFGLLLFSLLFPRRLLTFSFRCCLFAFP